MPRPDFIGVGMQKAGTRWLHDQLLSHGRVWLPALKELHWFDRGFGHANLAIYLRAMRRIHAQADPDPQDLHLVDEVLLTARARQLWTTAWQKSDHGEPDGGEQLARSEEGFRVYRRLFAPADPSVERLAGEITPAYASLDPGVVSAITAAFPQTKFILSIRHPVERAISAINMRARREGGLAATPSSRFDPALAHDPAAMKAHLSRGYFERRSSPRHVLSSWGHIEADRLLLVSFDHIRHQPTVVLDQLARFLDIDPSGFTIAPDHNRKADHERLEITQECTAVVHDHYRDEVAWCRDHLPLAADWT